MNIYNLLVFTYVLLIPFSAWANSFSGKVVKVSDGDTVQIMHNGKAEKIRLAGVDCPEKDQPFGQAAKRFTLDLAAQKVVTVKVETTDRYGRTVAEVFLPDGQSLNRELVRAGYAWWYRHYSKDASLGTLEKDARLAGRGLWADSSPISPWEWRRDIRTTNSTPDVPKNTLPAKSECGQKQTCKEMTSCDEAMFFLKECGVRSLDKDGDGIPCEALCR